MMSLRGCFMRVFRPPPAMRGSPRPPCDAAPRARVPASLPVSATQPPAARSAAPSALVSALAGSYGGAPCPAASLLPPAPGVRLQCATVLDTQRDTPPERAKGDPGDDAFLHAVGDRLRTLRARRGVTRRDLSRLSRVSERYIAQVEAGAGNVSILLLRRIARALGLGVEEIVGERPVGTAEPLLLEEVVAQLPEALLAGARGLLKRQFGGVGGGGDPDG